METNKGFVVWFTGLSGAGKTTLAMKLYEKFIAYGLKVEILDGDTVREDLTKDLGYSKEDRDENIRRVGYVAKLLSKNGIITIASFISPYKKHRLELRKEINNFIEVYVDTPIEICEKRDIKGMYSKAKQGKIKNFTGVSDPYEEPENPEIKISGAHYEEIEYLINKIIEYLLEKKYLI